MKIEAIFLVFTVVALVAFIMVDQFVAVTYEPEFIALEKQRITTSNKLASAKIVYENLNHVRELVQENMKLPGQNDLISHETVFFNFVTTCVSDLKMKLVSCKPSVPTVSGTITTYGYDLEVEGDFFSLGELYSKFENSRRIISLETFEVAENNAYADSKESVPKATDSKNVLIKMHLNTYRVAKG